MGMKQKSQGFKLDWDSIIFEIKDWMVWIGGSMIAALIIINIASAIMGTGTPFIAVTTGSMVHDGTTTINYVMWMKEAGFTQKQLASFPLSGGFNPGDAVIVLGAKPADIAVGEVIVFRQAAYDMPIIHRVINITEKDGVYYFSTKGDHNPVADPWVVSQDDVEGRAWLWIPFVGIVNTIFVQVMMRLSGK
jgi:signal peptidase I